MLEQSKQEPMADSSATESSCGTPSVYDLYISMEYGPVPEALGVAQSWLEFHGRNFGHFISGRWLKPDGRETCTVKNPTTGEPLATIIQGNKEDVNKAVRVAKTAYGTWGVTPCHVRARHLYNVARIIQKHQRLLSLLDSLDSGNLIRESQEIDLPLVVRHFYHYAGWAQLMKEQMSNWKPLGKLKRLES